jgi:phenylacetate-CoA ligase
VSDLGGTTTHLPAKDIEDLVTRLIPPTEMAPARADDVTALTPFLTVTNECAAALETPYSEIDHAVQEALVLRRLQQMVNTVRLNPAWRDRLAAAGVTAAPATYEEWQQIPPAGKDVQRELFMGSRPGLVVPLNRGGFEIVASGGTSSGQPVETVYSLRELADTYRVAGAFIGTYMLDAYLTGEEPKWLSTTLADYQMWSSGTMVGGVLQNVPGVNYIGAGPVSATVLEHMFSYPGPKALMGITAGIGVLSELGAGMTTTARESFRAAMYGSGVLSQRKRTELKTVYPNVSVLSYFAATQAEAIGLQRRHTTPVLTAVPGLHLVEIVDENGREVAEGEEGELVVTRLHAHEAPFLRFQVGDRVVRRPRTHGPGLQAHQFEYIGRTGDTLHLGDTQYSSTRTYTALCEELRATTVMDLDAVAHEIQFTNNRECKTITLTAVVDDVPGLTYLVAYVLGPHRVRQAFITALSRSLSLFNDREANAAAIDTTGYHFEIKFVDRSSTQIERTAVGKVPVVRDRG